MATPEVPSDCSASLRPIAEPIAARRGPRPGSLTGICIVTIVLGGLGLASSLMTLGVMAAQPWMQQMMAKSMSTQGNKEARDAQMAMQEQIERVNRRYAPCNWAMTLANLALSGALLAGGIMTLRLRPKSRKFLIAVLAVCIPVEILRAIVQTVMQIEMSTVVSESMSRMMTAASHGASGNGPNAAVAVSMARLGAFVGIAFTAAFSLAKLIFYVVSVWYLRCRRIDPLFERAGSGE